MRVISGVAKGKKLKTLEGVSVRPTTDKIKESIFNIVQFDLCNSTFLDLFSGSGQIGIEALSRGAQKTFFVDKDRHAISVIKENLKSTNLLEKAQIINSDAVSFLKKTDETFDIAFLDPPYKTGVLQKALEYIGRVMSDNGIIICENPIDEALPNNLPGSFMIAKVYKYGNIKIMVFRKGDNDES